MQLMARLNPKFACFPYIRWSLLFIGLFKLTTGFSLGVVTLQVYLKQRLFQPSEVTAALNSSIVVTCFYSASFMISGFLATYGSAYERFLPIVLVILLSLLNIGAIGLSSHLVHQPLLDSYKSTDGLDSLSVNLTNDQSSLNLIGNVQRKLKCCGIQSNTDWLSVADIDQRNALMASCKVHNSNEDIHKESCFKKISKLLQVVDIIEVVTVPIFIVVLIICIIAMFLAVSMSLILSYAHGVDALMAEKALSPLIFFQDN